MPAGDAGAECVEPRLYVFVAPVNLFHVVDAAGPSALRAAMSKAMPARMSGDTMRRAREPDAPVVPHDNGAVGVAQDDLRTHLYELIDEEKAAFEHFLMEKHRAACLRGDDDEYAEQVGL